MLNRPAREHLTLWGRFCKWLALGAAVGAVTGSACALFLFGLDWVTGLRTGAGLVHGQPWLLLLLPAVGAGSGWIYWRLGGRADHGNNLIIEEIHKPGGGVPARMAPLVLLGTLAAHLTGASVGREGTAVQMGGSLAGAIARRLRFLTQEDTRILLMTGVAAGFGGVFGTPLAGAIFAVEVLARGSLKHHLLAPFEWLMRRGQPGIARGNLKFHALPPCLLAAWIADVACKAWGIRHTDYALLLESPPALSGPWGAKMAAEAALLGKVAAAGAVFGLAGAVFIGMTHQFKKTFASLSPIPWLRPALGGALVIALAYAAGTSDYLGLGVDSGTPRGTTIVSCFFAGGAVLTAFAWKMLFTSVSVGSGLKGGEVTPLFFIGAALGNLLATLSNYFCMDEYGNPTGWRPVPVSLFAALGFVAVFAGATHTPLACTFLAMELFGPGYGPHFALACFAAHLLSGKGGLYAAQKP